MRLYNESGGLSQSGQEDDNNLGLEMNATVGSSTGWSQCHIQLAGFSMFCGCTVFSHITREIVPASAVNDQLAGERIICILHTLMVLMHSKHLTKTPH